MTKTSKTRLSLLFSTLVRPISGRARLLSLFVLFAITATFIFALPHGSAKSKNENRGTALRTQEDKRDKKEESSSSADAVATAPYFQGFETDISGWDAFGGAFNPTRVPSGTSGVTSKTGGFHAEAHSSATNWGGYNSVFPNPGYTTSVDVYLNMSGGAANDTRFDFTSAINNNAGSHRRDFAFNAGFYNDAVAPGSGNRFVVSASNSTGRANSFPKNPGRDPFVITATGWHTFKHRFYNNGGVLTVELSIIDSANTVLHTWTLSDPSDTLGVIGGNRYGWFANNEFPFLAIDDSARADLAVTNALLVVAPNALNGWSTVSQRTATGTFVTGPGTPPLGFGSYRMTTGAGNSGPDLPQGGAGQGGKTWITTQQYDNTLLANISQLGYSTYVTASPASSIITPSLQFQIDLDGNGSRDTAMIFEPYYSTVANGGTQPNVAQGVWQNWNARAGRWWFNQTTVFGGPQAAFPTYDAIIAAYPNAKIVTWYALTDGYGTQFQAGQNSAGPPWTNFDGNIDAFTISVNTNGTTYDFEPPCGTNVAAASYGATATASSEINANYPASGVINGEHNGNDWGMGGGWNDGTANVFPDDVIVNLNVTQSISEIDVYTLKNDFNSGSIVDDSTTFDSFGYGATAYDVQYWNGSSWVTVPGGSVTGNNKVKRRFIFSPIMTDRIRVVVNAAQDGAHSRIVEIEAFSCGPVVVPTPTPTPTPTATPTPSPSPTPCIGGINVAAAVNGGTAMASSQVAANYPASGVINGEHNGNDWGMGGGWNDGTANAFPDDVTVTFSTAQSISEIDVYTLKNDYNSGSIVDDSTTFDSFGYGATAYDVQYWNGSSWVTVPGGSITGNNKVKRRFIFSPIMTDRIRVVVNASQDGAYSRIVEIEAFSCMVVPTPTPSPTPTPTPSPTPTPTPCGPNVAAATNGATATASSQVAANYPASGVINGEHNGNDWGMGGAWNDGTANVFPDAVTVNLNVTQSISEIHVYTLKNDYNSGSIVDDSTTFDSFGYGATAYDVQYWNGSSWVTVPGGSITGNNKVKRRFIFSPITTDRIRVVVNASQDGAYSRIVEIEAFSCTPVIVRCVNPGGTGGCFATIQGAINASSPGDVVNVFPGTYDEDVSIPHNNLTLRSAGGAGSTNIRGPIGGAGTTVQVAASNVTVAGFTITRLGNNTTDWNNPGLNSAGVAVQGQAISGMLLRDNIITGNRTGVDVNNSNGHTIRNNVIDFNRTGLIYRNQTDFQTVVENFITNNWTAGIVFLDASGGTNSPVQTALHSTFSNNNMSANWYGQIVDRQSGGSLPAPNTTNLKNFRGNWYGTTSPVITTANSAEPGYAAQIPVAYGGSATPPGGQPDVAGPASANFRIDPILLSGTDTNVETTPGRGTFGFQGNPITLVSPADQRNWAFFDDFGSGTGSGGFEAGPATPLLGTGSAFLTIDSVARHAFEVFTHYAGTRMDDITSLSYSSYQDNNANTILAISLQFDIDYNLTDANNNFQGRLVFEPYQSGTVQQNVWQTWDARGAGLWYASNTSVNGSNGACPQNAPCTWQQVLTAFPNAGVRNTPTSGLLFKAGGPWSPGFDGNVDALNVGINNFRTTYDFEPVP